MAASFIGGGNWRTRRKPLTSHIMLYTSPWLRFLDFYSASSLKQQSAERDATLLISPIPSQQVWVATNNNFIVFGSIRYGIESTIFCTRDEHANHYTTEAVPITIKDFILNLQFVYYQHAHKLSNWGRNSIHQYPWGRTCIIIES